MEIKITPKLLKLVQDVELALITEDYRLIGAESRSSKLTADEIRTAIKEYGGTVTPMPLIEIQELKAINLTGADNGILKQDWFIDFDLHMDGKKSDLTVSLHIVTQENGEPQALVEDIHVL